MKEEMNLGKKIFIVAAGALLSILFFVAMLSTFKSYDATVTILVLPKSVAAAGQEKSIAENLAELPKTLNFYDRLLENNSDLRDLAAGKTASARKQFWNSMIKSEIANEKSSLLKITLNASNPKDSEILASKTARTLLDFASNYYNIKTDLDLRIIDGPISQRNYNGWPIFLLLSVVLGFLVAFILSELSETTMRVASRAKEYRQNVSDFSRKAATIFAKKAKDEVENSPEEITKKADEKIQTEEIPETESFAEPAPEQNQAQHDKEIEALNKIIQQDIYPNFPEMPTASHAKASAPDNLPIGDDSMFAPEAKVENQQTEISEQQTSPEPQKKGEPTPEELKQRLNQLLRGEM